MQSACHVEIQYQENTPAALNPRAGAADLIIMENLGGRTSARGFRSLDGIFGEDKIDRKSFYATLLATGQYEKRQTLIPVSFNLPILMFDAWASGSESSEFMINLSDLPELASPKNEKTRDSYTSMGFAPRWNPDFLVQAALMRGAAFLEGANAVLSWNDSSLRQTITDLRAWTDTYNGGADAEIFYAEKYLYDPPYRQVALGRVKYAFTTTSEFFLLPEDRRLPLDFRWLAFEKKIFAQERVLFAGIPVGSKNPAGAEAFLEWLFSIDTQRTLLELSRRKTPQVFGIASGFSSLRQINEEEFPRHYPGLAGHIPPEDILVFPHPLPYLWNRIKQQVIIPWMLRQLSAQPPAETLDTQLHGWLQHQTY
jgi:ABC-type glycerol-3-phosphate transport system substrate-binding protein